MTNDNPEYDALPDAPKTLGQWVCWRYTTREKADGTTKETKYPVEARDDPKEDHGLASADDPETWTTFEEAVAYHERTDTNTDGIGFVFTAEDVLAGIDLDDVFDPEAVDWEPAARELLDRFDSYAEFSPSCTGAHIIIMGFLPDDSGNKRPFDRENDALAERFDGDPDIEAYDEGRFFTMTGNRVEGTPATVEQRKATLSEVADEYLADEDNAESSDADADGVDEDVADESGMGHAATPEEAAPEDDDALIRKALIADNGEKFRDLQLGRWESCYPSQSEADLGHLRQCLFWAQGDRQRAIRLFERSKLADRQKWERDDYRERTVEKAVAAQGTFYDPGRGRSGSGSAPDSGSGSENAARKRQQANNAADPDSTPDLSWVERYDRELQALDAADETPKKGYLRTALADWFRDDYDFMAVPEDGDPSDGTLYAYDEDEQVFTPRGENHIAALLTNEASPTKRPGPNVEWTAHDVREVVNKIRNDPVLAVEPENLNAGDRDGRYLPVANGVLNLDTRELHDHGPEWKFTAKAPVEHNPDAPHPEAFESLLDAMTAGDDLQKQTLKEWGGFGLTPGYDPEKFLLLHAPGQNGKGTYFYTLRELLGPDLTSGVGLRQMTGDHFETSQLKGSRLNLDGETPGRKITTEQLDVLKGYTGGDFGYARDAYETAEGSGFENTAKLGFAANEPPRFHEDADGIERRILPVRLDGKFTPDPDDGNPTIRSKTEVRAELTDPEEQSGILNVLLDALEDFEDRGKQFAIETRGTAEQRFAEYMAHADPIHGFADACLDADAGGSYAVTKDAVYNAYREMCDRNEKTSTTRGVFFRELGMYDGVTWTEYRPGSRGDRPVVPYLRGLWFSEVGYQYVKPTDADDLLGIAKAHARLDESVGDAEVLAGLANRDRSAGNSDSDAGDADAEDGDVDVGIPEVPADATGPKADRDRLLRYLVEREAEGKPTPGKGELVRRMDERYDWRPNHTNDVLGRLRTEGDVIRDDGGFAANL